MTESPLSTWIDGPTTPELLRELLHDVIDPELGVNIVDLGLVYDLAITDHGVAQIQMTLTTPGCPLGGYLEEAIRTTLWGAPGITDVDIDIVWEPAWAPAMMSDAGKAELGWGV